MYFKDKETEVLGCWLTCLPFHSQWVANVGSQPRCFSAEPGLWLLSHTTLSQERSRIFLFLRFGLQVVWSDCLLNPRDLCSVVLLFIMPPPMQSRNLNPLLDHAPGSQNSGILTQRVTNPPPGLAWASELSLVSKNGFLLECGQCLDLWPEVRPPRHFGPYQVGEEDSVASASPSLPLSSLLLGRVPEFMILTWRSRFL